MKSRRLLLGLLHTLIVAVPVIGLVTIAANTIVTEVTEVSASRQLDTAGAQAVDSHFPQTSEGDDTMTSGMTGQRRLVRPVTSYSEVTEPHYRVSEDSAEEYQKVDNLAALHSNLGQTPLSPTYLPPGVSLQKVSTDAAGNGYTLEYVKDSGAVLVIMVGGKLDPEGFPIKEGHSEEVTVEGATSAQIVRGMWVQQQDSRIVWDPNATAILFFYHENQLVMFMGFPESGWSKDELVAMANSLEASQQPGSP